MACGALSGLDGGLYHFDPDWFGLARLRPVDVRAHLARAAGDPALTATAVVIVITGIPWRTTWKYGERGWRHVFWDAGSLLANLVAVAAAHGLRARLVLGFVDREVSHILGIDGIAECPLAVVAVGEPADQGETTAEPSELDELRLEVEPLSTRPLEFPLVTDAEHATSLDAAEARDDWRRACTSEPGRCGGPAAPDRLDVPDHGELGEPIETLILRRGSTRLMARQTVPPVALIWVLGAATRPVPADAIAAGHTLLTHELATASRDTRRGCISGPPAGSPITSRAPRTKRATWPPTSASASPWAATAPTRCSSPPISTRSSTRSAPAATGPPTWKPGSSMGACSSPPTLSAKGPPASPSSTTRSALPLPPTPAACSSPRSEPPPTGLPPAASPAARQSSSTSRP